MARQTAILFAALWLCAHASSARAALPRVLLVGDSITFGWVAPYSADPHKESFAVRLRADLRSELKIINGGCPGATTSDWRPDAPPRRYTAEAFVPYQRHVPRNMPVQLAVVMLGTNDAWAGYRTGGPVPVPRYKEEIERLVANLLRDGAEAILLTTTPPAPTGLPENFGTLLQGYASVIADLCKTTKDVSCGPDVHELLDPVSDLNPKDIHPNAKGHAAIAAALAASIRDHVNTRPIDNPALLWSLGALLLLLLAGLLWGASRRASTPERARDEGNKRESGGT